MAQQLAEEAAACHQMLEIVEVEQDLLFAEVVKQLAFRAVHPCQPHVQGIRRGHGDALRVGHRLEHNLSHPVAEVAGRFSAELRDQAAFAIAPGSNQGDQSFPRIDELA